MGAFDLISCFGICTCVCSECQTRMTADPKDQVGSCSYCIQRKYLNLHPLMNGSSSYIVSVYTEIQSPNPNDWWKPEYWKKSQFILHSLSVFTWPWWWLGWWLHASCNILQAGKGSHLRAPINPTVILLRSMFLISFSFFWFPEASWKSFQSN